MKRFQFTLHGILKVRHLEEDRRRADVAKAHRFMLDRESDRERLLLQIREAETLALGTGRLDLQQLESSLRYAKALRLKLSTLEGIIERARQHLLGCQQRLQAARLETKRLEVAEEQQRQRWSEEARRDEFREADERNSRRTEL
ncbi:MAG: hypothetical protein RL095_1398 [Verrucomicrobiota bacterium]|jgi:hypothetical protein